MSKKIKLFEGLNYVAIAIFLLVFFPRWVKLSSTAKLDVPGKGQKIKLVGESDQGGKRNL